MGSTPTTYIVWSIAGTDSGGGAGLSADQRAVEAFGLHLCPVPAALTAQNSTAVTRVQAVDADLLQARLLAAAGRSDEAWLVEHAAMPEQRVTRLADVDRVTPYFSILLIHGQGRRP